MKKAISLFTAACAVFLALASGQAFAQEKTPVKVKNSEVVTGVVIVHVQKGKAELELQCNEGAYSCAALPSGDYLMKQLAEHYGLYDCRNVEIYRGNQDNPEEAQKVGAYCLIDK